MVKANLFSRQLDFELEGDGDKFTGVEKEESRVAIVGGRSTRITNKSAEGKKKAAAKKVKGKGAKKRKR